MLNIEKHKDEIAEAIGYPDDEPSCSLKKIRTGNYKCNNKSCLECAKETIEWMLSETYEPILDDVEREYLKAVIKPFRKQIDYIKKGESENDSYFLLIAMSCGDGFSLPYFPKKSKMYAGMKEGKRYTLEELEL